jgi:uracil-DNA glycosylase
MVKFGNDWDTVLAGEFEKEYYLRLREFLKSEYVGKPYPVYPAMNDIFNALRRTAYKDVKIVIIGQDPYHGPNQAHGLCFSVQKGVDIPPSLKNIYKELQDDIGFVPPNHGCLYEWADNGILLLNSVLTVRGGAAGSHRGKGWEIFTDRVISELNQRKEPIVFMLWGNYAKEKGKLVTSPWHHVLTAAHPSPLSAYNGFFGCRHFSKAMALLGEKVNFGIN